MTHKSNAAILCLTAALALGIASCGSQRKLADISEGKVQANLSLPAESDIPELEVRKAKRDTIVVRDDKTGKDILIMKAVRDDATGEMVANDVLDAAIVTARFRNLAERGGKVDLRFQITVPAEMRDSKWQLRFYPDMFIQEDSIRLESVYITGKDYRRAQLKGYQQYERFLSRIVSDTTRFVDISQLEIFLQRNIPQIYAFKGDSTEVSDETFLSYYGVSERQAIDHYTLKFARWRNERRKAARDRMYRKYVKAPIVTDGIRLDTVLVNGDGDYVYHYVQTINTRPRLRKVDIVLSGDIWESDRKLYKMPATEPLTFYISSVSAFTDMSERYLTRVIERRAEANASYHIVFERGKADVRPDLPGNRDQIDLVKGNLADLLANEVYDLDSIVVVANASPEGSWRLNDGLSRRRGESVSSYFRDYMREYRRTLEIEGGFTVDERGRTVSAASRVPDIRFVTRSVPENWDLLDRLVRNDPRISDDDREAYFSHEGIRDKDARENAMRGDAVYKFLADSLYPRLRVVDFAFHLHRKGMIKDTVHTTEIDARYMEGVRLLKDMEYDEAVKILGPYQDYNAAVAYTAAMRNASAMLILRGLEPDARVNYLKAIIHARLGEDREAVQCYLNACSEEPSYIHRGNLDPEISQLIKLYGLNRQAGDDNTGY